MDILDRSLAHNAWTTNKLIEQSRGLTEAQLDQKFDIGLKTVRATIDHIIDNIEWWTDLMNGLPQRRFENLGEDAMTLDGFARRLESVAPQFAAVARRAQTEGRLDKVWQARADQPTTFDYGNTIIHVITHSAHHRGQLIYMLKKLGVADVIMAQALSWDVRLSEALEVLVKNQQADGGPPISQPAPSLESELEYQNIVTLNVLKTLRAYGKV